MLPKESLHVKGSKSDPHAQVVKWPVSRKPFEKEGGDSEDIIMGFMSMEQ
jgi:hypothetical protein